MALRSGVGGSLALTKARKKQEVFDHGGMMGKIYLVKSGKAGLSFGVCAESLNRGFPHASLGFSPSEERPVPQILETNELAEKGENSPTMVLTPYFHRRRHDTTPVKRCAK